MLLPVFKPFIRRADMDSVLSCLISDEIGSGKISQELIGEFSSYLSIDSGVLVRDYYRAISLALDLLDLKSGSTVLLSPLSPGAYIDVFRTRGINPLFPDVDPHTALIDPSRVDLLLENNIDAILLVHPLGVVEDMEYFTSLGIPLIEDISENFGSSYREKKSGSYGSVTIFSMEADKILTCGGGSAVFVNDQSLRDRFIEIIESYGDGIFLSDINASLALTQLRHIDEILNKRLELSRIFVASLNKTEHKTLKAIDGTEIVHFSFPVLLRGRMNEVISYVLKKNIEVRRAFPRTALERASDSDIKCPVASGLILRTLLFPLYPSLGKKNAEMISKVISTLP